MQLQVVFRERATYYRALLRKMTCTDKVCYGTWPPCSKLPCETCETCETFHLELLNFENLHFERKRSHSQKSTQTHTHTQEDKKQKKGTAPAAAAADQPDFTKLEIKVCVCVCFRDVRKGERALLLLRRLTCCRCS